MDVIVAATSEEILPSSVTFVVIGFAAFLLPLIARVVRVPAVVLEILFGLLIGPQVLGLIGSETASEGFVLVLAEIGLFLLMFLAGFEIDFTSLEREGIGPILFALAFFVGAAVLAWFGLGFVELSGLEERIYMTLLVSAASVGIIIPSLRSTGRTATRLGQAAIVIGIVAEFLAATGIIVYSVWYQNGFGVEILYIAVFTVILLGSLWIMRTLAWWYPDKAERLFSGTDPDELGIRFSLALLFIFVGVALALGMDPILGAFMAGAIFAFVFRNSGSLEERLSGFAYGFLIPIFFISVGIRFPLDALSDTAVLVAAVSVIIVAIAAKLIPAPLLMLRGLTFRESVGAGILLAGQLSVIIALAEVGVQIGIISEGVSAGAVLLVGVTALLAPVLFKVLCPPIEAEADTPARV